MKLPQILQLIGRAAAPAPPPPPPPLPPAPPPPPGPGFLFGAKVRITWAAIITSLVVANSVVEVFWPNSHMHEVVRDAHGCVKLLQEPHRGDGLETDPAPLDP
jgi:hypothetical protein